MAKPVPASRILPLVDTCRGNLTAIARKLKVSRTSIHARINETPELAAAVEDARESMIDMVESSFYEDAVGDSVAAKIFFLKTRGQSRGYIERQDLRISGPDGGPVNVNVILDDGS